MSQRNCLNFMLIVSLCFFLACSKKESHELVNTKLTDNLSISPVVSTKTEIISEGNKYFLDGKFQQAINYYEEGLKENLSVAYYNMGVSYYMLKNLDNAEKYFKACLEQDPHFEEAMMNLVVVLAEKGDISNAEQYSKKLVVNKKTARIYTDIANLSLQAGKTAQAAYYYEKAVAIDNSSQFIVSNYANFLIGTGNIDAGEELLNKLIDKDFTTLYNLAYIAYRKGDKDKSYELAKVAAVTPNGSVDGISRLADLYGYLKKYEDEANILKQLISWDPKKDYILRLINSYIHDRKIDYAIDEATLLLKKFPKDEYAIVIYYRVLIASKDIKGAGDYIKTEYQNNIKSDILLYTVVKHLCLYDHYYKDAYNLIKPENKSSFANLARVAYYVSIKDYTKAEQLLTAIPKDISNDYYIYTSFILFKKQLYNQAYKVAMDIDESSPEYFWYHFVLAWNLKQAERIHELLDMYKQDYIISARIPTLSYKLSPISNDMPIKYFFNGRGVDIAYNLAYPLFIEPDEMYPFVLLGYKLLKGKEGDAALNELQKSVNYSKAVELNNTGVKKLLNYDYSASLNDFKEAESIMKFDPFIKYNIGIAFLNTGSYTDAISKFEEAIRYNQYFIPAHLGLGLAKYKIGEENSAKSNFRNAVLTHQEYSQTSSYTNYHIELPSLEQSKYLANLALEDLTAIADSYQNEKEKDSFIEGVYNISKFFATKDSAALDILITQPFYKSIETAYLTKMYYEPIKNIQEKNFDELNVLMQAKYIRAFRTKILNEEYIKPYLNRIPILAELLNFSTLIHNKDLALKYMQLMSSINFDEPMLHKSSFYYFLWMGDFLNAEASYKTLIRLQYSDQLVEYYLNLYYLLNYKPNRLDLQIASYRKAYPDDYRGKLIDTARAIFDPVENNYLNKLSLLLSDEPYLFNKMPLEIDIEQF